MTASRSRSNSLVPESLISSGAPNKLTTNDSNLADNTPDRSLGQDLQNLSLGIEAKDTFNSAGVEIPSISLNDIEIEKLEVEVPEGFQ